jgi:uncharacterized spore protein YtfJ
MEEGNETYTGIGGGSRWAGIQIMKTAILIHVLDGVLLIDSRYKEVWLSYMMNAVPHCMFSQRGKPNNGSKCMHTFIFLINLQSSTTIAIRLMIICIRSWTSKTQRNKMEKNTGTLTLRQ